MELLHVVMDVFRLLKKQNSQSLIVHFYVDLSQNICIFHSRNL